MADSLAIATRARDASHETDLLRIAQRLRTLQASTDTQGQSYIVSLCARAAKIVKSSQVERLIEPSPHFVLLGLCIDWPDETITPDPCGDDDETWYEAFARFCFNLHHAFPDRLGVRHTFHNGGTRDVKSLVLDLSNEHWQQRAEDFADALELLAELMAASNDPGKPALVPVDSIGLLNELSDFSLDAAHCSPMQLWEEMQLWASRLDARLNNGEIQFLDTKYLRPDYAEDLYDTFAGVKDALESESPRVDWRAADLHTSLNWLGYILGLYRCLQTGKFTDAETVLLSGYPYLAPIGDAAGAPQPLGSLPWERLKQERKTCKFTIVGKCDVENSLPVTEWQCQECGSLFGTRLGTDNNDFRICDAEAWETLADKPRVLAALQELHDLYREVESQKWPQSQESEFRGTVERIKASQQKLLQSGFVPRDYWLELYHGPVTEATVDFPYFKIASHGKGLDHICREISAAVASINGMKIGTATAEDKSGKPYPRGGKYGASLLVIFEVVPTARQDREAKPTDEEKGLILAKYAHRFAGKSPKKSEKRFARCDKWPKLTERDIDEQLRKYHAYYNPVSDGPN